MPIKRESARYSLNELWKNVMDDALKAKLNNK